MEALLADMTSKMNRRSVKRKSVACQAEEEISLQEQDALISSFRSWIHQPIEPEKRMMRHQAEKNLGCRSSNKGVVKITNLFPQEVAEGECFFFFKKQPSYLHA